MKQCPQCNRTVHGSVDSFLFGRRKSASGDPRLRPAKPAQSANPNTPIGTGHDVAAEANHLLHQGWVAPDERPPMYPVCFKPPLILLRLQPTFVHRARRLAVASMITGIVGLVVGTFCLGPLPGIVALALGLVALSQIKKYPDKIGGKPFASGRCRPAEVSAFFFTARYFSSLLSASILAG